jgi:EF-P beta-lysylation protein EpmB
MKNPALKLIESDAAEKWQQILADLITDPKDLVEFLALDPAGRPPGLQAQQDFPLRVPRPFAERMEKGNWQDPLLRQVWPDREEEQSHPGLVTDPLAEAGFNQQPGLIRKYQGRALLMAAPHCAIHCRYCFRRHFDYQANTLSRAQWQQSIDSLRQDLQLREVILSGGDPLANSDAQLAWLLEQLASIPQLTTLRIHSRLPVVIPQRMSRELLAMLSNCRLQTVLVIHSNHSQELDARCLESFAELAANGITMLNQAVILKGVNDNVPALKALSERLFQCHVLPYYLHLPDQVAGTRHFLVDADEARALIATLRSQLPGYLVPRLVQEIPGEQSKTLLA